MNARLVAVAVAAIALRPCRRGLRAVPTSFSIRACGSVRRDLCADVP